jgi:uncharacterized iron-regulated protein
VLLATAAMLALSVLGGCASHSAPHAATLPDVQARTLLVVHGDTGKPFDWRDLVAAAAASDAVLIGEVHNQPVGQAFQAAFFEDLLAAAPTSAAALEFYERDHQAAMDDYLDGIISPHEFRRLTNRNEGDDCPGHRAMIEMCKTSERPVIAANAPRRYVKVARTDGYERLSALGPVQRRLYRVPDSVPTGPYRDKFFEMMRSAKKEDSAHATDDETRIEAMFRAQTLWDWTMADSVARGIDDPAQPSHPVVLVVGKFHTDSNGGLVQALRSIRPSTRVFTITFETETSPPLKDDRKGIADAVVYIGPEDME